MALLMLSCSAWAVMATTTVDQLAHSVYMQRDVLAKAEQIYETEKFL